MSGKEISKELISTFPENIDVCGENGEFHTFVFEGPIFKYPIAFEVGEKVFKELKAPKDANDSCISDKTGDEATSGFWYTDLVPAGSPTATYQNVGD
jgi:hypothetical protein